MFNFYVFQQTLLFVALVALVAISLATVVYHRWLTLRVIASLIAIVALAAAAGVLCA